jgi:pimeloyl-ACP methyl ester carboxylesterase
VPAGGLNPFVRISLLGQLAFRRYAEILSLGRLQPRAKISSLDDQQEMLDVFVSPETERYLLESKRSISVNRLSKYVLATALFAGTAQAAQLPSSNATTTYHRVQVDGVGIFYREAGPRDAPTIVLLHGFPSSSREFDTLIPSLATKYQLIAPDYPGFGLSDAPSPTAYTYTFDHLAQTMSDFLEKLKVTHYTMYLHDYGAPIGFRIILAHPNQLHALIIQNGNIYKAGLGAKWTKIAEYWADPNAHPEVLNAFLSLEATKERHVAGTSHPDRYDPDTWISEYADLSRPGQREIQGELLYDYRTNVASYSKWQTWLREHQPPTLVVWGEHDPSFVTPGAEAFRGDLPNAEIHLLDAGHFALDEQTDEIADLILQFMAKHPG